MAARCKGKTRDERGAANLGPERDDGGPHGPREGAARSIPGARPVPPGRRRRLAGGEVFGREVDVEGRAIRYEVAGERGEPVVLVHGLSGSSRWWDLTVPALAARHRVYLVDLPGFGSMHRSEGGFVLAEAAGWLSSWMDVVGLGSAHLVGHSMGGYISLMLAARRPDLLRRLVLVSPAGVPTGRSMYGYLLPLLRAGRYMTPGFLPILLRDALSAGPLTLLGAAREILAEDVRKHLRRIEAPTLLVWGRHDTLVPPSAGDAMREEIPNSRLLVIPGAGHVPMFERASETNAALLAFLAGEAVGE